MGWETSYGFFPGGDPRLFTPDEECCSSDEMAHWEASCAEWNKNEEAGVQQLGEPRPSGFKRDEEGNIYHVTSGGVFGIGTYQFWLDE